MNSLEEIALKVAKECEAVRYVTHGNQTETISFRLDQFKEFARRLVAALGAQEPVGEILHNPGGCYEGSPIPAAPYDYTEFFVAMPPPGTKLFAAPVLPSVREGWQMVPKEPTDKMVNKYLTANTNYWFEQDRFPTPVGKWRKGTPQEATAEGYKAMLAAAPSPQEEKP